MGKRHAPPGRRPHGTRVWTNLPELPYAGIMSPGVRNPDPHRQEVLMMDRPNEKGFRQLGNIDEAIEPGSDCPDFSGPRASKAAYQTAFAS